MQIPKKSYPNTGYFKKYPIQVFCASLHLLLNEQIHQFINRIFAAQCSPTVSQAATPVGPGKQPTQKPTKNPPKKPLKMYILCFFFKFKF